jgi:hypothetical protein
MMTPFLQTVVDHGWATLRLIDHCSTSPGTFASIHAARRG